MQFAVIALLCAVSLAAADWPAVIETAAANVEGGRVEEAIRDLERAIREQPGAPPEAFLLLMDGRMRQGDSEAALESAEKGITAHPGSAELLKAASRLLLRDRRRSAAAGELLARAVEIAPKDPETHYYRAQWACLHNEEALCIDAAEKALTLAPGNRTADLQLNTLIGIAANKLNQPEKAEAAFRRAIEDNKALDLRDPLAAYQYVDFLLRRARDEEAQETVQWLLLKVPTFGPALLARAQFLARQGQQEVAITLAEKALVSEWMDKDKLRAAHMLLARAHFLLGDDAKAAKHQKWIEENPH